MNKEILNYHKQGKIGIQLTKPCDSQYELSMAYTPGVAIPCLEIEKDENLAFEYTNKANLVAVISDGTAVLGLGNIGPLASKPVMEGKAVLFKKFAKIDAFDIKLDVHTIGEIVATCKAIAPTFGGINLEDISTPRCFEIERILKEELNIPVFHDDQHGTAIITTSGLINVLELTGKKVHEIKVVINGAGATGISCAKMYRDLGVRNIIMCDSKGVINTKRIDLSKYKMQFVVETSTDILYEVIEGSDIFLELYVAGALTKEMVARMAVEAVIFALANPRPEILPEEILEVRSDAIIATGGLDYPNQSNNVLGFPFIFRGALDVRARKITGGMKMVAARALAALARKPVPDDVKTVYHNESIAYGKEHIIPKEYKEHLLCPIYACPKDQ